MRPSARRRACTPPARRRTRRRRRKRPAACGGSPGWRIRHPERQNGERRMWLLPRPACRRLGADWGVVLILTSFDRTRGKNRWATVEQQGPLKPTNGVAHPPAADIAVENPADRAGSSGASPTWAPEAIAEMAARWACGTARSGRPTASRVAGPDPVACARKWLMDNSVAGDRDDHVRDGAKTLRGRLPLPRSPTGGRRVWLLGRTTPASTLRRRPRQRSSQLLVRARS